MCYTWEERLIVELDDLTEQYNREGALTHSERTDFHWALISYIMNMASPPFNEYEIEKMTVQAVVQVIQV